MTPDSLFHLSGKVAVITGSGKGIGEGIAKLLSEAGAKVVVSSRTKADIEQVSSEIIEAGGVAYPVVCDMTNDEQVSSLAKSAISEFGGIDIWVNNVGGSTGRSPLAHLSRSDWDRTIALTLTSVFVGCQVAAKNIKQGSIINISSRSSWCSRSVCGCIGSQSLARRRHGQELAAMPSAPGALAAAGGAGWLPMAAFIRGSS